MSESPKSFFSTLPGILTGLASVIVAITGLYAATDGFNFKSLAKSEVALTPVKEVSLEDHQRQLEALKRQQELDELRIAQEKKRLLAEQELAELKAKSSSVNPLKQTVPTSATSRHLAQVGGNWSFTNMMGTYTFAIEQNGTYLSLQEFDANGTNVGNGSGTVEGRQVYLNWVEPYLFVLTLEVEASLTLSADGSTLMGTMYVDGNSIPISLFKR